MACAPADRRRHATHRALRGIVAIACALLAAGCADLGAIHEYASAAADVTGNEDFARRWAESETRLRANQLPGDPELARPGIDQAARDAARDDIDRIHGALNRYFEALAALADGRAPDLGQPSKPVSDALKALAGGKAPVDRAAEAYDGIVKLLAFPLDVYRRENVIRLVHENQQRIDALLGVLRHAADLYRADLGSEAGAIVNWAGLVQSNDPASSFLLRRYVADVRLRYQVRVDAVDRYATALDRVIANHAKLAQAPAHNLAAARPMLAELGADARQIRAAATLLRAALP